MPRKLNHTYAIHVASWLGSCVDTKAVLDIACHLPGLRNAGVNKKKNEKETILVLQLGFLSLLHSANLYQCHHHVFMANLKSWM